MTIQQLFTPEALQYHASRLKARHFSAGFDRMTADAADTWVQINGQRLCQQLMDGSYQPMPAMGFYRAKKSGGARLLSRLTAIDTIIQLILLEALTTACEKAFSPSSFGYRPGRGVHMALEQYCTLGSQWAFAAKADLRGCFDHFSYDGIETALGAFVDDADLLALIMKQVRMPLLLDGQVVQREKGLLQGAPISPLVMNICLHSLDRALDKAKTCFIRYADDLVLFSNDSAELEGQVAFVWRHLKRKFGLTPNQQKNRIAAPAQMEYLGCRFVHDRRGLLPVAADEPVQDAYHSWRTYRPGNPRRSVDILTDGILRQRDFSLAFENEDGTFDIPIEVSSVINVYSDVVMDSGFLSKAMKRGICINLFDRHDKLVGRITPETPLVSPKITFEQLQVYYDAPRRLALAKQFVLASLHHMKLNIRNHYKNYKEASFNTALRKIYVLEKDMQECAALEQLLLLEARTKELYYDCFDGFLRKDGFTFEKRTRRPPQNEINALLSFGNMVLYGQFAAKINRSPLDVRIGFVHATNRRMESLNLDLADVYKPLLVDRTALALINRNALRKHHFTQTENGGVYLTDEGRRIFLAAMYEKQGEWLQHKGERINYDQLTTADIQALVRYFRFGEKYVPYRQVK